MTSNEKFNLKLVGQNQEDLKVISAYLQDSVVIIKDIVFLKKNRTFVMMVNRFMWEDVERGVFRESKRIRCAVKFDEVISVMSKNINQKNENKPLECLAIESSLTTEEKYKINIFFAGGGIITIILEVIQVIMYDIGEPWLVKHVPKHKI
tara:strand:- start:1491 stop:1940 length:450 start_codon:yes stop_codon:yes gene_type:complete